MRNLKNKSISIISTFLLLFLMIIIIVPSDTIGQNVNLEVSKIDDLTCGETIWVNITNSGLEANKTYYVHIWDGSEWENIANKTSDENGNINIELHVPYRHPLGKYNLSLWDCMDDSGTQFGENVTLNIANMYLVRYQVESGFVDYAIFNKTYSCHNCFKILIYNWTGVQYRLFKESVGVTLYDPAMNTEIFQIVSTGICALNYVFDFRGPNGNFETNYWVSVNKTATEFSMVKLPIKLNVTADLPTDVVWGDTVTISGYVRDGNGEGIGGYTVQLYTPVKGGYICVEETETYSTGRYSLSVPTDGGSAGTWYLGTYFSGCEYRINETDKLGIKNFIMYHSFEVASHNVEINVVNPDQAILGFRETINVSIYNHPWDDEYYDEMWIHVTGLELFFDGTSYDEDDVIVVHTNSADSISSNEKYAYYEFDIEFKEVGTATIIVTHSENLTFYEENDEMMANITGYDTLEVIPSGDMNIFVSNMPNNVMIDDSDNYVWFNISQKITIEIFGENLDNPMNASISIMGCGLNIFIDEDEAVEKDYFIDNGIYEVNISPKTAGTLTIAVTNRTENKEGSKDFSIAGLSGSVTTSVGDDKKITFGTTETITVTVANGQYSEVHLCYFDKDWANEECLNNTVGDGTAGNGRNGEFEFVVTENDIPYDFGYMVIVAKAGGYCFYDIVEIDKPILKKMFIRGRITNLNQLEETSTFNSIRLRCINFSPFSMDKYQSNEKLIVSNEYVGILTKWYILGFFEGALA